MFYYKSLLNGLSNLPSLNLDIRNQIKKKGLIYGWNELYNKLKDIDYFSAKIIHPNDIQRIVRALEVYEISGRKFSDLKKKTVQRYKVTLSII